MFNTIIKESVKLIGIDFDIAREERTEHIDSHSGGHIHQDTVEAFLCVVLVFDNVSCNDIGTEATTDNVALVFACLCFYLVNKILEFFGELDR